MLDLISNILNVTYTTGTFWGGGFGFGFAAHQSNIFANLEVFKKHNRFYWFSWMHFLRMLVGKGLGNLSFNNIGSTINKIGGMPLAGKLNLLGRPQKAMYNSLLSPAPIGFLACNNR